MAELHYLDDAALAAQYAVQAAQKGKGRLRIAQELSQKGLDARLVKDAMERLQSEEDILSERERAIQQAQRMLPAECSDEKTLARIARRLSALGYEASVVWDVLESLR